MLSVKVFVMRLAVTLLSAFAIALATMAVHVGGAMAMEGVTDTPTMAEMSMGAAETPACPPEMCAKMKACAAASAPVAAVAPATSVTAYAPEIVLARLAQHGPDFHDPVTSLGLRRPPRFI